MDIEKELSLWSAAISTYISTMDIFQQNSRLFFIDEGALKAALSLRPILLEKRDVLFSLAADNYISDLNHLIKLNDQYNNWLQINSLNFPHYTNSMEWWSSLFLFLRGHLANCKTFIPSNLLKHFINNHIIDYIKNTYGTEDEINYTLQVFDSWTHGEEKVKHLYQGLSAYDKMIFNVLLTYNEYRFPYCIDRLVSGALYQVFFKLLRKIRSQYTMGGNPTH